VNTCPDTPAVKVKATPKVNETALFTRFTVGLPAFPENTDNR
jgi:hypothetical protein